MRTKNSFFNFLASELSHAINLVLSFICRTIFIYTLSQVYLGINGLFGNILTVLSLAELGIGTAMIYHIYKPVAEGNILEQQQLMNMYRRLYSIVAGVIGVVGLSLVPFLRVLVKDYDTYDGLVDLRIIYLLYLFNTVSSYFFSYKRAIIDAHQKQYIGTIINTIFTTIQFLTQMVVLLVFKNFVLYLGVQIVCNVLTNIVVAKQAEKMFPYIKENKKAMPPKEVKDSVYKNIGAMFFHRLGSVVVNDTDNLIMSAFVGLTTVGIYSNYQMIQYSINVALNGVFGAFTASIGNLGAIKEKERMFHVYKTLNFLGFWLYGFSTVAFTVMYNPFIEAWAGKEYLFPMQIVLMFNIVFYVSGMRVTTLTFRDALGLYWYDRYKPIFEIIINLSASLYLVQKIGVLGIFFGTLISTLCTGFWVEPYVTYKHGFHKPVRGFFGKYVVYAFSVLFAGVITYWICNYFTMGGWIEVICKAITCALVYNLIIFLMYFKTKDFKALWDQIMILVTYYKNKKANN
ncbi:MAG: lipopolysaccharide biosynthesis protein [Lachnospiraceae bacterium]|nr:lipopolysaccharide biosynthesis protein [Lachnospiraceae bacterium]